MIADVIGCYQTAVKCSDSGAEKVEILSDSIQELTWDNSWVKTDIYLALAGILLEVYSSMMDVDFDDMCPLPRIECMKTHTNAAKIICMNFVN